MSVELILLDNVEHLGSIGKLVKVSDGYARNYLLPKGLASKATPGTLRQLEAKKKKYREAYDKQVAQCREMAEQITNNSVTIPMQAGDNEKLFGSVTAQQIVDAIGEMDIHIEKKQILLQDPIRKLGVYSVDIHLHPEVSTTLKVWVVKA